MRRERWKRELKIVASVVVLFTASAAQPSLAKEAHAHHANHAGAKDKAASRSKAGTAKGAGSVDAKPADTIDFGSDCAVAALRVQARQRSRCQAGRKDYEAGKFSGAPHGRSWAIQPDHPQCDRPASHHDPSRDRWHEAFRAETATDRCGFRSKPNWRCREISRRTECRIAKRGFVRERPHPEPQQNRWRRPDSPGFRAVGRRRAGKADGRDQWNHVAAQALILAASTGFRKSRPSRLCAPTHFAFWNYNKLYT